MDKKGLVILNTLWTTIVIFITLVFFMTIIVLINNDPEPEIINSNNINFVDKLMFQNFLTSQVSKNENDAFTVIEVISRSGLAVNGEDKVSYLENDSIKLKNHIRDYFKDYYVSFVFIPNETSIEEENSRYQALTLWEKYKRLNRLTDFSDLDNYDQIFNRYKRYYVFDSIDIDCPRLNENDEIISEEILNCDEFNYETTIPTYDGEEMIVKFCIKKKSEGLPDTVCRPNLQNGRSRSAQSINPPTGDDFRNTARNPLE